jgi:hypothetical protein
MRLDVLRLSQRNRPKTRPSAARQKRPALHAGFPRPKGKAVGDGGAGTTPSETAAAAKCPITRYVNRAVRPGARSRATAWRGGGQPPRSPVRITSDWTASGGLISMTATTTERPMPSPLKRSYFRLPDVTSNTCTSPSHVLRRKVLSRRSLGSASASKSLPPVP